MKEIYALYLPQYHEIPENNEWWGQGYTEWNAVKAARPFFKGHQQPKEPLNDRYYDLSDETGATIQWQAEIAKKYGIDGFAIYHYWFKDGKKLLEKPMKILLNHTEIDIGYFVCWANEPWKRTWYQNNGSVLMPQEYGGEEEWVEHYNYLTQFFTDIRYKKIDNRPVVAIYNTAGIDDLKGMIDTWNRLAREDGFDGIYVLGAMTAYVQEKRTGVLDGQYMFEPAYTLRYQYSTFKKIKRGINRAAGTIHNLFFQKKKIRDRENIIDLYSSIQKPTDCVAPDVYAGLCPGWDNTPRKQDGGCIFKHSSPERFGKKLQELIGSDEFGDMIIINAWNEWGEGAYLEPDTENGYSYLEAVSEAKQLKY